MDSQGEEEELLAATSGSEELDEQPGASSPVVKVGVYRELGLGHLGLWGLVQIKWIKGLESLLSTPLQNLLEYGRY